MRKFRFCANPFLATEPVSLPLFKAICDHTTNHDILTKQYPFKGVNVLHLAVLKIDKFASANVFSNLNRCLYTDIDAKNISSQTPLSLAASSEDLEIVSLLISKGANLSEPSTRDILLYLADKLSQPSEKKRR